MPAGKTPYQGGGVRRHPTTAEQGIDPASNGANAVDELRSVGEALRASLVEVIAGVPGGPHKPTPLSKKLGLSRVTVSRILRAIEHESPFEVLEALPGPESLRVVMAGAKKQGVSAALVTKGTAEIDRFAALIRDRYGTRAALDAAIRPHTGTLRERVDHAGRAEVFKGMSRILGVEAKTWLTSMLFTPSTDDASFCHVTTVHGAIGLRRLRPDTPVYFSFGPPPSDRGHDRALSVDEMSFDDLCENQPARVVTEMVGGRLVHRLLDERLGKDAVMDMLSVSVDARGSRRYADEQSALRGVSLFVDIPVRVMVCDVVIHRDIFPGATPELIVFNPGARGPANPNDPSRTVDRVDVSATVESVDSDERFTIDEVPGYTEMMARVFDRLGKDASEYRVHRVRLSYPVTAFQHVVAFRAPAAP